MNERTRIRSLIGNGDAMTRTLIATAAGRSARGPDDGIGLDEYVDWLTQAGYPIERVSDFGEWLQRFETGLSALPERERRRSVLQMLLLRSANHVRPLEPNRGAYASTDRFRTAVRDAKIGSGRDIPQGIPHVSAPIIVRYATDLQLLGLL